MMPEKEMLEVPVAGGSLAVARWPGDGPTLLLVHGISASHLNWVPVMRALPAGRFNVLAPDLRGRGASSSLPGPYGFERHVADLCALVDALDTGPVTYVGHSMGAYIGTVFGATATDRLARLVLVDGGIALPLPRGLAPEALLEEILGPALARLSQVFESREAYRDFWRQHPAFADPAAWTADLEAYFDYDLEGEPPRLSSRVVEDAVRADGLEPMLPAMVDMIDRVPVPMLMLTAERGLLNQPEPLMPLAAVEAKAAALPQLAWQEIADTNHYTITLGSGAPAVAAAITAFAGA
ncbi:MAG: alpha/beta fold hydrolase [Gammaproteobacteria bacterium]